MMTCDRIYFLTFHGLGSPERRIDEDETDYWLDAVCFESILDRMRHHPNVYITFDDSNSSDFTIAYPALNKRNMQARFFVVTERIGSRGFLNSEQIAELSREGMMIGSHGKQHRPWTQISAIDLNEELTSSRMRLESIVNQSVTEAACPLGNYNRKVMKGLRAAGYSKVYTSDQGSARLGEWISARNTILRNGSPDSVEDLVQATPHLARKLFRTLKLTLKRFR